MSNTERQRLFRERHPGYYQRLHARKRAKVLAALAEKDAARAAAQVKVPLPIPGIPTRLALPAPIETFEFPLPIQRNVREMAEIEGQTP